MLSREEARDFYDRFGARQDDQGHYEDPPLRRLIDRASFDAAGAVCEFGCGTGRLALDLLENHLPPSATYFGCDVSATMIALARERLTRFGERARLRRTDGEPQLPLNDASVDRFVSTYVLDLLSAPDIAAVLAEGRRVLVPGGLLGVVGLTTGITWRSRLTSAGWRLIHALRPAAVGGCRPLRLLEHADLGHWEPLLREVVVAANIPSEVVVLRKLKTPPTAPRRPPSASRSGSAVP